MLQEHGANNWFEEVILLGLDEVLPTHERQNQVEFRNKDTAHGECEEEEGGK